MCFALSKFKNRNNLYVLFNKLIKVAFVCFAALFVLSCGGGGGGGGIVAFQSEPQMHNGGDAGGFGTGNQTGGGFGGGSDITSSELLISKMAALNDISKVEIHLTINGAEQEVILADATTTTDVLPKTKVGDIVSGYAVIFLPDNETRRADLDETEIALHNVLEFKVPYYYKAYGLSGTQVSSGTYYARDGINLASYTDANIGGWKCAQDGVVHYGSYVTGVRGDIRLDAVLQAGAGFVASASKTTLTADGTCTDSATITITGGAGPFTVVSSDTSVLSCTDTDSNIWNITFVAAGSGEAWFTDNKTVQVLVTDTATNVNQPVIFTLKNKYKINILNPNNTAAGVLSPNEFDAGSTLNMASLASVVSDPSPRQIVAYKDTSTGGNTYKTTDTLTLNSSNFTSRNITLQAKLNFTATISGGDTTISGQDGTYANPYHLKLGGTATEQKINIGITDKVGDIRIRAGTTGYVGVTGSGTSFAAEISSGIDPNSVPATPILLKIIDVVPGTASTTAAESNPANVYATKEVYVQIDRPTLTVTFNANGGTNAPASVSVLYGNKISAPTTSPSKNGATFGGWYTSNDGGATQFNFTSTSITSNLTLYAKWNDVTHSVTYNNSGCSQLNVNNISASYKTFTEASGLTSLPTPSLPSGYTFDGWYSNSGLTGNRVTSISANTTTNQTLYAKINVDVTVDVRGTTNTIPVQYGNGLAASDLTSYAPTNLKHWSSVSSTGTIAYAFNNSNITMPMTLYAVIESNIIYCYTTDSDVVPTTKISEANRKYIEGTGRTLPTSVSWPVATSTFEGWYTSPARTDDTKVTSISTTQTGNVTLYAKFSVAAGKVISIDKATLTALAAGNPCVTFASNTNATDYRFIPEDDITQADLSTLVSTLKTLDVWFGLGGCGSCTSFPAGTFDGCTKLVSMTLPGTSGFRMSTAAFTNCPNFTYVLTQSSGWKMDMTTTPAPDNNHACSCPDISTINGETYGDSYVWVKD